MRMQAAIQPFIDAAISKTVNVPEDYPFEDFESLYLEAWHAGLKGITTYRPNSVLGAVLSVDKAEAPQDLDQSEPDRRIRIADAPTVALAALRWPHRPKLTAGSPVLDLHGRGAGQPLRGLRRPRRERRAAAVRGLGQRRADAARPRGARQEPVDGHARPGPRLAQAEAREPGEDPGRAVHAWRCRRTARTVPVAGTVSAFAKVVQYRCAALGVFDGPEGETPLVDAMFSRKEPKSGVDGTLSWTVDILNPTTGDDFAMFVKECVLPDGTKRPFSVWLSGAYPIEFNGLTKSLSLDMRVIDPAWIGKKLRGLKDLPEAQGDFFARVPGTEKQAVQPSTHRLRRAAADPPLRDARRARPRRLPGGRLDGALERRAGARRAPAPVARPDLPGMRPPDADPPRRLRLLHLLRPHRRLRLTVQRRLLSSPAITALFGGFWRPLGRQLPPSEP